MSAFNMNQEMDAEIKHLGKRYKCIPATCHALKLKDSNATCINEVMPKEECAQ